MTTVFILGAGASGRAGYPTAGNLLEKVGEYCGDSRQSGVKDAWDKWSNFREKNARGAFGALLKSNNPEIMLSALDLLEHRDPDSLEALFSTAKNADSTGDHAPYEKASKDRDQFKINSESARIARHKLLDSVQSYLEWTSCNESEPADRRDYLRKRFKCLSDGDAIITFNWDTIAERTLGEMGFWNPTSGYGFLKPMKPQLLKRDKEAPHVWPSQVKVLKLHGSVGWKKPENDPGSVYFGKVFLQYLRVVLPGFETPVGLCDTNRSSLSDDDEPIFAAPSFLKAMPTCGVMQEIWWQAHQALARADRVEVWGYSLPSSDTAARVLLNPLRFRIASRQVEVIVTDPCEKTRKRWNEFLDAEVAWEGTI